MCSGPAWDGPPSAAAGAGAGAGAVTAVYQLQYMYDL